MDGFYMLPQNSEAEALLLGCILHGGKGALVDTLRVDDFAEIEHRALFSAIARARASGADPDVATVCQHTGPHAHAYIQALADAVVSPANAPFYAQAVQENARRRRAIDLAGQIADAASAGQDTAPLLADLVGLSTPATDDLHAPVCAAELDGKPVPPRRWLVRDMIPAGNVTLLYGDGGTGKSLAALQLAAAVATGRHWFGIEVNAGKVIYLSAEDDLDELHRRLDDISRTDNLPLRAYHDLTLWPLAGADAVLATLDRDAGTMRPTALLRALDGMVAAGRPTLLVVDTLADVYGGDENVRTLARQFVSMLRGIALEHRCAVLVLAHPSLSGLSSGTGTSGSTGWNNSVRSRLYMTRPDDADGAADPDARVLKHMKSNYSGTGTEILLRWQEGVFVAEAGADGGTVSRISKEARERAAEEAFLTCLRELRDTGRFTSHTAASRDMYAPKLFRTMQAGRGYSKRDLETAMARLFDAGTIRVQSGRTTGRNYGSFLVEVVPEP